MGKLGRAIAALTIIAAVAGGGALAAQAWESYPVVDDGSVQVVDGYRRGKRVRVQVLAVDWVYADVKTARAFVAMREAARAEGIELYVRSGFRTFEQQAWLYQAWQLGLGNKAARPGHSNHQLGRALDIVLHTPEVLTWLKRHAKRYGFRQTVRSEPWHWEHTPVKAKAKAKARRSRH